MQADKFQFTAAAAAAAAATSAGNTEKFVADYLYIYIKHKFVKNTNMSISYIQGRRQGVTPLTKLGGPGP
jgi:hypothetical protein